MKNIILSFAALLSFSAFSSEPPNFLENFSYRTEMVTSEDGETFECYVVSARNNDEFKSLNKMFRKMKYQSTWREDGIVYCVRRNSKYTIVRGWAWGFRAFSIYEN